MLFLSPVLAFVLNFAFLNVVIWLWLPQARLGRPLRWWLCLLFCDVTAALYRLLTSLKEQSASILLRLLLWSGAGVAALWLGFRRLEI